MLHLDCKLYEEHNEKKRRMRDEGRQKASVEVEMLLELRGTGSEWW
jgi:hypothetical protein